MLSEKKTAAASNYCMRRMSHEMTALDACDEQLVTEWEEWSQLDPTQLP